MRINEVNLNILFLTISCIKNYKRWCTLYRLILFRVSLYDFQKVTWYSEFFSPIIITHLRRPYNTECCKGDEASQWRNPKFDPPPRPNPVADRNTNRHRRLRRGPLHSGVARGGIWGGSNPPFVQTPHSHRSRFFHSRKVTAIKYYNVSLTIRRTTNSHNLRKTNHLGRVVRLVAW